MPSFSLKYRIAAVIFALEAIMMAVVISTMLSTSFNSYLIQLSNSEQALGNLLSDMSHFAINTEEFDTLQAYIEQVVEDPHITAVYLANRDNTIIASSDASLFGKDLPQFTNTLEQIWHVQELKNQSSKLGTMVINYSHAAILETNTKMQNIGILVAIIGMSIIAIIGLITGHLLTRRLSTLTHTAQSLAEGQLDAETGLKGNDEIAIVGKTFDRMAKNIQNNIQELKTAHDEQEKRVTERTAELAIARDEALQSSRTKSIFLANMSHELRTPLNAIIGYSELICEESVGLGNKTLIQDINKISTSGKHLLTLISDILDLSKIEAGKMKLNLTKLNIHKTLNEIFISIKPMAEKNNNIIDFEITDNINDFITDDTRLRQILLNLLSNACKFTENGNIKLKVEKILINSSHFISFQVTDTGIGISPEKIKTLFDEFTQADDSTTRKYGGTGLGLAISKRLCEALGGSINIESSQNQGATFIVNIPDEPTAQTKKCVA